jgi:hypothetical protein
MGLAAAASVIFFAFRQALASIIPSCPDFAALFLDLLTMSE